MFWSPFWEESLRWSDELLCDLESLALLSLFSVEVFPSTLMLARLGR